jgi:hypothetical protein
MPNFDIENLMGLGVPGPIALLLTQIFLEEGQIVASDIPGYIEFQHNDVPVGDDSPSMTWGSTVNDIGSNTGFACNIYGGGTPTYPNAIKMVGSTTVLALSDILGGYDNTLQHSTGGIWGAHNRTNYAFDGTEQFMFTFNSAGTVSTVGTAVTGVGTNFTGEAWAGGYILISGQTRRFTPLTATTGTLSSSLSADVSGVTYQLGNWPVPNPTYTPDDLCNHMWLVGVTHAMYRGSYCGLYAGSANSIGHDPITATNVDTPNSGIFCGTKNVVVGPNNTIIGGKLNIIQSPAAAGFNAILSGSSNLITAYGWSGVGGQSCSSSGNWNFTFGKSINNNGGANGATAAFGNAYTTTATNSLVFGNGHSSSSGNYNLHGGFACVNTGSSNLVVGNINQVTKSYAGAVGRDNLISGEADYSFVSGYKARANKLGQVAQASGFLVSVGDTQTSVVVAKRNTTGNTPTVLTLDGAAPVAANVITVSSTSTNTWCTTAYKITVTAMSQGSTANTGRWNFEGLISKGANNAATVLQAGEAVGTPQRTGTLATATVATSADTTNGALTITVTGIAATNINWNARVELTEVTYV